MTRVRWVVGVGHFWLRCCRYVLNYRWLLYYLDWSLDVLYDRLLVIRDNWLRFLNVELWRYITTIVMVGLLALVGWCLLLALDVCLGLLLLRWAPIFVVVMV